MYKLLQTMQWSKLCWESSWQETVKIADLLPKVGDSVKVTLDRDEDYAQEGHCHFLWLPPHSELNYLSDRPYEFLKSRIISGCLSHPSRDTPTNGEVSFDFLVEAVDLSLTSIETMAATDSYTFPKMGVSGGSSVNLWEYGDYQISKAIFGNYVYLDRSLGNGLNIEAVLEMRDENLYLIFLVTHTPVSCDTEILKYRLSETERRFFSQAIENAQILEFEVNEDITEDEVQGASYY
jgi:hypothetical protein